MNSYFDFACEGVTTWYDFTCAIAAAAGHQCDIRPCRSEAFPTKAVRPHYGVLDKTLFRKTFGIALPWWPDALKKCLERL